MLCFVVLCLIVITCLTESWLLFGFAFIRNKCSIRHILCLLFFWLCGRRDAGAGRIDRLSYVILILCSYNIDVMRRTACLRSPGQG